ncbi:MAG: glycosyltransferase [Opitutaceae bacterium]|nr:glycosyltransferase [Opitutaceae bacterium]
MSPTTTATSAPNPVLTGITESREQGLLVLSPSAPKNGRRVLFINSYGGSDVWTKVKQGLLPPHHMWGCIELVRMGYEVALAEPLHHFNYRKPFPHDLRLLRVVRSWLRPDDIVYCGHTLLFWVPLLRALLGRRRHLVSMTYAREELDFAGAHRGIIALTPAAADQARKIAPQAKVAHLAWGCDLGFFPQLAYDPHWFLSCGITHRDFATLSQAARQSPYALRLICPGLPPGIEWSPNVTVIDGGKGWNHQKSAVSYQELFHQHYAGSIASLIILKHDPVEYTAVGFTNLLEALALARPVIVTRTGAIPGEIDVEAAGCGLFAPPNDPAALAAVIDRMGRDPAAAQAMGQKGRALAERHYNIGRYADGLHRFFASL